MSIRRSFLTSSTPTSQRGAGLPVSCLLSFASCLSLPSHFFTAVMAMWSQGITKPPGNIAYNASKAALNAFTEGLAHELRETPGCKIKVHLLVPG